MDVTKRNKVNKVNCAQMYLLTSELESIHECNRVISDKIERLDETIANFRASYSERSNSQTQLLRASGGKLGDSIGIVS